MRILAAGLARGDHYAADFFTLFGIGCLLLLIAGAACLMRMYIGHPANPKEPNLNPLARSSEARQRGWELLIKPGFILGPIAIVVGLVGFFIRIHGK